MITKYKIPKKYLKMIDDDFLMLLIKKLFFYDPTVFEPYTVLDDDLNVIEEVSRMDDGTIIFNELHLEGTGIWYDSFKETCEKLNKNELYKYWVSLPWYYGDLFDDQVGTMMAKRIVEKQDWKNKLKV